MPTPLRVAMIGCGGMARHHVRALLRMTNTTEIVAACEPSAEAYAATAAMFTAAGKTPPPNEPDLATLLANTKLDAAFIITPHAYHHDQTLACLEAGVDVLLEKPMVITAAEAESLIAARDRTRRLLVVAFPGSLSPQIRMLSARLRQGDFGRILAINGVVWQNWGEITAGTWRQVPAIAGGGFMFDTGAHLLNTVADIAGEDFAEVAAWLDSPGRPVETLGAVIARLRSGALVTFTACGEAIPSCSSEVRVFCEQAIATTGVWGERLALQLAGEDAATDVRVPASLGVWETFLAVRSGEVDNPCPPEVGLRMARLWDAIRASAAQGGAVVRL